jgi:RNA polymerase sigma-70 factor (sigma-E family)
MERTPEQMQARDDEAFRGFVAARWQALVRTGYLLTGDQQLAEDLVQTALEKTARHWHGLRHSGAAEAYVRRTMYRENISRWRRLRVVELPTAALPEPPRVESETDRIEDRMLLRDALLLLGRRQRTVLVLRYFEDMSEQQVADTLGIGVGTVKSTAHRALAQLRVVCANPVLAPGGGPR